uniref:NAB domain-containing protein n=1 Tax=Leersia perrieri TaxID=77586 RepID=A0A0D9UX79_9ORYZ
MKRMHRMPTRKSHSWWWDSHISPKNNKWLAENLEEMDKQVKDMLRLIEDEGDSFAKKAEMYFQRRPLLVTHVENFYRMYRALAERYDNVTGELRKNIPSSLQSQGSLGVSESDSETQSTPPTPEPNSEEKTPKEKRKSRAAGFDVFLGSGGSSDVSKKGSDGSSSSSSDSDSEVDEAREGNGGVPFELHERIAELEDELQEARDKIEALEEKNTHCQCEKLEEKLKASHSEISSLQKELEEKVRSLDNYKEINSEKEDLEAAVLANKEEIEELKERLASADKQYEGQLAHRDHEIEKCKKELEQVYDKYSHDKSTLETEIRKLQDAVKNFESDVEKISQEKSQLEAQVRELEQASHRLDDSAAEIMKLQETIKDLEARVNNDSNEKKMLEERAIEFERVRSELEGSRTEVAELQAKINNLKADLDRALQDKSQLESRIKDLEQTIACNLEEFSLEKTSLGAEIQKLTEANASLEGKIQQLHDEKSEASMDSEKHISKVNQDITNLKTELEILSSEKATIDNKLSSLLTDITTRDEKIKEMDTHLNQLHLEHVKLIGEADAAQKAVSELRARVIELEEEVEKQKAMVTDGAEGKREAIRQLCFSLEHYRHGYHQLRQMLQGHHKRPLVMAT